MKNKFEIKYEIFEDHIEELKQINVNIFDTEFHQIYGTFTIIINDIEYIPYPPEDVPLSVKQIFSELILTHLEFLIEAVTYLETEEYLCIKYIENPFTWLEIKTWGEELSISELELDIHPLNNWIYTDPSFFANAKVGSIKDEKITRSVFVSKIKLVIDTFLNEIKEINHDILCSKHFAKLLEFHKQT